MLAALLAACRLINIVREKVNRANEPKQCRAARRSAISGIRLKYSPRQSTDGPGESSSAAGRPTPRLLLDGDGRERDRASQPGMAGITWRGVARRGTTPPGPHRVGTRLRGRPVGVARHPGTAVGDDDAAPTAAHRAACLGLPADGLPADGRARPGPGGALAGRASSEPGAASSAAQGHRALSRPGRPPPETYKKRPVCTRGRCLAASLLGTAHRAPPRLIHPFTFLPDARLRTSSTTTTKRHSTCSSSL